MAVVSQELAKELADCVARNEGLRESILARGLPLKETMIELRKSYRAMFTAAHEEKIMRNG